MTGLPKSVSIRDVALHDGLQIEQPLPTDATVRILEALVATGVPRIELAARGAGDGGRLEVIIATEELAYMLADSGVHTGIDLDAMLAAAADTERAVGHRVPGNLLRAGDRLRDPQHA